MDIQWKESYALGIPSIDDQHKELFRRLNQLMEAVEQGSPPQVIRETIAFLTDYVHIHFRDEEQLMQDENYPGLENHQAQHQMFVDELEEIKIQAEEEPGNPFSGVGTALIGQLSLWLADHILDMDQSLKEFLQEKQAAVSGTRA